MHVDGFISVIFPYHCMLYLTKQQQGWEIKWTSRTHMYIYLYDYNNKKHAMWWIIGIGCMLVCFNQINVFFRQITPIKKFTVCFSKWNNIFRGGFVVINLISSGAYIYTSHLQVLSCSYVDQGRGVYLEDICHYSNVTTVLADKNKFWISALLILYCRNPPVTDEFPSEKDQ